MTSIIYMIFKEALLSLIGKIGWKIIGERLSTRLVVYGLNKLKNLSTNSVVDSTVDDIIKMLKGKGLKALEEN